MIYLAMKFLDSSCFFLKTLYKATTDLSSTLLSGEYLRDNFTAFGVDSANLRYLESLILNGILSLFPLSVVINEIQSLEEKVLIRSVQGWNLNGML